MYTLEATFSVRSSWNLVGMFVLIKSRMSSNFGHVGSKTRSLDQILEKPCVCSRCLIFSQILVKFGSNLCLEKITDNFEIWSCGVKNRSLGQILGKPWGHIFSWSSCNMVRMFVLIKSRPSLKLGYVGSKTRSLGKILEKPCVRSRGHIFSPILIKLSQNVCLDKISDKFEIWSCGVKS